MPKPEKEQTINELKECVTGSPIVIMTKYVGLNAAQVTDLRKKLRDEQVRLKVYKNTLAARALEELGLSEAIKFMEGPTAWAFGKDPVAPAKVLKDFAKKMPLVSPMGGIFEGRVVSKAQIDALANLPPRQVLLGQLAATVAAPLRNLLGVLTATPRNLVNVLDQVRKQKEETGAAA